MPAERASFASRSPRSDDLRDPGVGLDLVVVDDRRRSRRGRGWRPSRSDSQNCPSCSSPSPVSTKTRPPRPASRLAQHHALGLGDAHAERAGVGLTMSGVARRRDGRAGRAAAAARAMPSTASMPEADQHGVERRRVVPLGREDSGRSVGPSASQEQPADDVEAAEARADVARPGAGDHVERVDPGQRGERRGRGRRRRPSSARRSNCRLGTAAARSSAGHGHATSTWICGQRPRSPSSDARPTSTSRRG